MPYLPRMFRRGDLVRAADLAAMDAEIVRLGKRTFTGGLTAHDGPDGLAVAGPGTLVAIYPAVATSTITARATNTVGSGTFKLRSLSGTTLSDSTAGLTVFSNFSTSVASGKAIMVGFDSARYWLISADCP